MYIKSSPEIMQEVFQLKEQGHYNLRTQTHFEIPHVKTVNYGLESIRFLGPKILEALPNDFKRMESVNCFKTAIKKWKPEQCPLSPLQSIFAKYRLLIDCTFLTRLSVFVSNK